MKNVIRALACVCVVTAAELRAQETTRYGLPAEPQHFEILNIFRLYHLVGRDTVGGWAHDLSAVRQEWTGLAGDSARVIEVRHSLGLARRPESDTLTVSASGRVVSIDGHPAGATQSSIDWFPRLPEPGRSLRPGMEWRDTIARAEGAHQIFDITRTYKVRRALDTLGVRALEIVGRGRMHYRMTTWTDSLAGQGRWQDVSGPVVDTFWFDPGAGRFLGRKWSMDLRGTSAPIPAGPGDTTAAGLPSRETIKWLTVPRYEAMVAGLPEGDTTYSFHHGGLALQHTTRLSGDTIRGGMGRMDGMYGTNTLIHDAGRVQEGWTLWVDSLQVRRIHLRTEGGELVVDGGQRYPLPTTSWGVADYGMDGMLSIVLRAMPVDGAFHPLAIYRPWPARWDTVDVAIRPVDRGRLIRLRDRSGKETVIAFDGDGTWLLSGAVDEKDVYTVPLDRSRLFARLQAFFAALNGPGPR